MNDKFNWIILVISWVILGLFAYEYYFSYSYNRDFRLMFLLVMALSVPLFIFAPVSQNKPWPLMYRMPLILVTAIAAFLAAQELNPCSNGCDDEPIMIAWLVWLVGFAFLKRKNLSWKYWLFLWGLIHVFSMNLKDHFGIGIELRSTVFERSLWHLEFYTVIAVIIGIVLSLYLPIFFQLKPTTRNIHSAP